VRVGVAIACGLAASTVVDVAFGTEHRRLCEESDVRIEGKPAEGWADALGRVCGDLLAMKDRDTSASVRLLASDDDLVVEVTLADGRSAIRRIKSPFALRAALEALLTLPPRPAEPPPAPAPLAPAPVPTASEAPAAGAAPPPAKVERAGTAELALSAAGRVGGGGATSLAPTAEANLITGNWLFGLWARWDVVQHTSAPNAQDFEMDTVGAGLGFARRTALSRLDLDIGFSPRLIVETQNHEIDDDDETRVATDVRLAAFARVVLGHGALRPFAAIDGEISPGRLRRELRLAPALPALPAWSTGIAVGVSWTAP
jgi:hypothetical protein